MKFKGYVTEISDEDVYLIMTPDDGEADEHWTVEHERFPKAWLKVGAICELDIHSKKGTLRWMFDCSYWTVTRVAAIKEEAKSICERLGIKSLHETRDS